MRQKNGFTLVELLVVIGIISVLISMLLPALNKARQSAQTVACASQMRQITQAAILYANENKGYLPPAMKLGTSYTTFFYSLMPHLGMKYTPYQWYGDRSIFHCPSDFTATWSSIEVYKLYGKNSYAVNAQVSDVLYYTGAPFGYSGTQNYGGRKLSTIKESAATLLLVEMHDVNNGIALANADVLRTYQVGYTAEYTMTYGTMDNDVGKQGYHNRSGNRGVNNWAFIDGHVTAMNWRETTTPHNLWEVDPAKK